MRLLNAKWREAPPLRRMVAAFVGYEPPKRAHGGMTEADLRAYMAETGITPKREPVMKGRAP